jgi:PEP-CTERM motif
LRRLDMRLASWFGGLLSLILMVGADSRASAAIIYSAAGDFSITSNPNGVWSYGTTGTTLTGPLTLYTNTKSGIGGIPTWIGWEGIQQQYGDGFPLVGKNTGTTTVGSAALTLLPGELAVHPAPDGAYAVVRFAAPTSDVFLLNAVFEGRETAGASGTNTDVHVLLNGVALFNGAVIGFGPLSDQSFATTLNLSAGDRVDFSVGFGSDRSFLGDTTGLDATLTAVPEPSSLVLFSGLGLMGLVMGWRRRKRTA